MSLHSLLIGTRKPYSATMTRRAWDLYLAGEHVVIVHSGKPVHMDRADARGIWRNE